MTGDTVPLRIVSHLLTALSHSVRTPLSVIANDLHFSKTTGENVDAERVNAQCNRIIDTFLQAKLSLPDQELNDLISIEKLCDLSGIALSGNNELSVSGSRAILEGMFLHIGALSSWKGWIDSSRKALLLSSTVESSHRTHFSLFSEAFNEILCRDTIHAPLADAALLYLGATVSGELSKGELRIELIFADE